MKLTHPNGCQCEDERKLRTSHPFSQPWFLSLSNIPIGSPPIESKEVPNPDIEIAWQLFISQL
jgi:hypothetical protein